MELLRDFSPYTEDSQASPQVGVVQEALEARKASHPALHDCCLLRPRRVVEYDDAAGLEERPGSKESAVTAISVGRGIDEHEVKRPARSGRSPKTSIAEGQALSPEPQPERRNREGRVHVTQFLEAPPRVTTVVGGRVQRCESASSPESLERLTDHQGGPPGAELEN